MHRKARGLVKRTCKAAKGKPPFTWQVKEGHNEKTFDDQSIATLARESQGGAA